MKPETEAALAVAVCGVLAAVWIVNPGWALLLVAGSIGGLGVLAWLARRAGI